ncbi:MAG TPA: glucosylglycerol-phosphate synthase [Gemmatimonadaceae bacterium]|nr:glucosylglycerol-phosphate synthase [Gemmatimonadaceae bacterium]
MSELVVVYHRQPFERAIVDGKEVLRSHRSPNGIVPTLRGFFKYFDAGTWVAWTEVEEARAGDVIANDPVEFAGERYNVAQLGLTKEQVTSFYKVTSKAALWPILHSFVDKFDYDAADWTTFREVNQLFADATCKVASKGAVVWVHDYNLWLVPKLIREQRPDLTIAFFHHTPFPSSDVFGVLPWRTEITESLLCCDRVGFHIPRYAENFAAVARAFGGAQTAGRQPVHERLRPEGWALQESTVVGELLWNDRRIKVDVVPLGVDVPKIVETVQSRESQQRTAEIRASAGAETILFAVSRVDYTKGTVELIDAYGRLLDRRPELIGKVKLFLVCVPPAPGMKVYDDIQAAIEQRVGALNGKFSTLDYVPLVLFAQPLGFDELMAWYRAADVCWITPLRDGLNLVAKEFIAAKEGNDGKLVLSEFTGAAVELEQAILMHPYSARSMDRAIDEALDMPHDEEYERMQRLYAATRKHDLAWWIDEMLKRFGVEPVARSGAA